MNIRDLEKVTRLSGELTAAQAILEDADRATRYLGKRFKLVLETNSNLVAHPDDWHAELTPAPLSFSMTVEFLTQHITSLRASLTELGVDLP